MSNSTRPSSSYDERYVVPLEAGRRGAHRARVSPVMAVLPIAAVVGIVVGAIALVYVMLGGLGDGGAGSTAAVAVSPSATPTSTPASPAAETSADASEAAGTGGSSAAPGTGAVDKSITLDVFNGTSPSVSGLAKKAANKLAAAGWTTGKVETWTGAAVTQTTVYYAEAGQKGTAQAVVKSLGRGVVKLSAAKAGDGMAVVIGNDFPGAGSRSTAPTARSTTSKAATRTSEATATSRTTTTPAEGTPTEGTPTEGDGQGGTTTSTANTP